MRYLAVVLLTLVSALPAAAQKVPRDTPNGPPACGPSTPVGSTCTWTGGYRLALTGYGWGPLQEAGAPMGVAELGPAAAAGDRGLEADRGLDELLSPDQVIPGLEAVLLVDRRALPSTWSLRFLVIRVGVRYGSCAENLGASWEGTLGPGMVACPGK